MEINERFRDRADAGRCLAANLVHHLPERPIVVALPRGGVVTAVEIARALDATLDVLVARKLGALLQPEFGVGAIAPGGVRVVDRDALAVAGTTERDLELVTRHERAEMSRRERRYRGDRAPLMGGAEQEVLALNRKALDRLGTATKELRVVPHTSHLVGEPGALEEVARLARGWFVAHLVSAWEAAVAV